MPVIINASTSAGAQIIPDNSGVLQFQSNGANTTSIAANGTLTSSNLTTTGRVTAGNVTLSASGLITFADATTQSTAGISGSFTLLGTIVTTSGSSQSLSNLTLTSYKQIVLVVTDLSFTGDTTYLLLGTGAGDAVQVTGNFTSASDLQRGLIWVDLTTGIFSATVAQTNNSANRSIAASPFGGDTAITTASTTIYVAAQPTRTFDAGSILVYGVK